MVRHLAGIYFYTISLNLFYHRHLIYIVCHLAILNYCLALGLPLNILEFLIEVKIPVIHLLCPNSLPVV